MAVFTYTPTYEPVSSRQPRVLSIKFGDGYEQRAADGIHADLQKWDLTFADQPVATADAIESFLSSHGGRSVFQWTPVRSATQRNFICRSWTRRATGWDQDTITATFEEVADP